LERYDTIGEIKNWITNIVSGAVQELQQDRKNNVKSVIKKAQEYIILNYSKADISLIAIADHVYLNPAYFSKLYKKETGESYVEFITKVRVEEAKRLLKESNARIADVGNAVGYPNAQYFCTLFKKITGVSPAEFRESRQ
jgi:two-component system response regulator YesN